MSKRILGMLCTAALVFASPAESMASEPGYEGCRDVAHAMQQGHAPENPFSAGVCLGTIQAMRDMAVAERVELGRALFCVPKEVVNKDIVGGFVSSRYADEASVFTIAVIAYLVDAYQCN